MTQLYRLNTINLSVMLGGVGGVDESDCCVTCTPLLISPLLARPVGCVTCTPLLISYVCSPRAVRGGNPSVLFREYTPCLGYLCHQLSGGVPLSHLCTCVPEPEMGFLPRSKDTRSIQLDGTLDYVRSVIYMEDYHV